MSLDSSLLLKVKEHVTSKLKSIGAFIDEELPDYIMVMVANKKSESSMTKDLQLFLGDDAATFTKWLHQTLETLTLPNQVTSKEKEVIRGSTKSKSSGKKISKVSCPEEKLNSKSRNRSRSRSPVKSHRSERKEACSREPHAESDLLNIHPEENEFTSEGISSTENIKEERKVVCTSCITPTSEEPRDPSGLQSVIQVKKAEKRVKPDCLENAGRPGTRLLKRAVEEVRSSTYDQCKQVEPDGHPPSRRKRTALNRSIACPDVSSTSSAVTSTAGGGLEPETRFYVTLSGSTDADANANVLTSASASAPPPTAGTSVRARLGRRHIMAYPEPVHPKGVLVTSTCPRLSVRDRLGPRVQPSQQQQHTKLYSAYRQAGDIDVYAEAPLEEFGDDDSVFIEEEVEDEEYAEEEEELTDDYAFIDRAGAAGSVRGRTVNAFPGGEPDDQTVQNNNSKMRLIDKLNQSHLVVSLTETKADAISARVDNLPRVLGNKNSLLSSESTNEVDDTAAAGGYTMFPSTLKRCRFWPQCRNAEKCAFVHPTQACPAFPRCGLAATCCFIHPVCRYGMSCIRKDCAYDHTVSAPSAPLPVIKVAAQSQPAPPHYYDYPAPAATSVDKVPCRYGRGCTRPQCPFYHHHQQQPKPAELTTTASASSAGSSANGARVTPTTASSVVAVTASPVPCRYGSACTSRPKCPFLHIELPRPYQLKWKAEGKALAEHNGTNPAVAAASATAVDRSLTQKTE